MDLIAFNVITHLLKYPFEFIYCWGCWRCLKMRRFPLFLVLHILIAFSSDITRALGIDIAPLAVVILVAYLILPLLFVEKLSLNALLITLLMDGCNVICNFAISLAMGLLSGDFLMDGISEQVNLFHLTLAFIFGAIVQIAYIGVISATMGKRNKRPRPHEPLMGFAVFQYLTFILGFTFLLIRLPGVDLAPVFCGFSALFVLETVGLVALARTNENLKRREIADAQMEASLHELQQSDAQNVEDFLTLRKVRHDLNNQLSFADSLASSGRANEALDSLQAIKSQIPPSFLTNNSGEQTAPHPASSAEAERNLIRYATMAIEAGKQHRNRILEYFPLSLPLLNIVLFASMVGIFVTQGHEFADVGTWSAFLVIYPLTGIGMFVWLRRMNASEIEAYGAQCAKDTIASIERFKQDAATRKSLGTAEAERLTSILDEAISLLQSSSSQGNEADATATESGTNVADANAEPGTALAEANVEPGAALADLAAKNAAAREAGVSTGNAFLDVALSTKKAQLQEAGIALDVKARVPMRLPLAATEISALAFNLVDNAANATKQAGGSAITVTAKEVAGNLTITVTNPCDIKGTKTIKPRFRTSRDAHEDHGWGTMIICHICEKHGGFCKFQAAQGTFTSTCMIPLVK